MSSEFTTQVWERVCVICGSVRVYQQGESLACGGCHRRILRVRKSGDHGERVDLAALARQAWDEVA